MKLIGSGSFTKVYRQGNSKFVHIKTCDPAKECMAMGWFPNARCFPKVKESNKPGYDYKMTYYPKTQGLKQALRPKEYAKYQALRSLFNDFSYGGYEFDELYKAFEGLKDKTLSYNMCEALNALSNYGSDVKFEISPRNVAVTATGTLILLDVFFFKSKLWEVRGSY